MASMVVPIAFDEKGKVVENDAKDHPVTACDTYSESSPLISESLGCLPHQVPARRAELAKLGLTGCHVLDDGRVALTDRGERGRRGLMKALNSHDEDAGYRD